MSTSSSLRGRIPKAVAKVVWRIREAGYQAYPVGGVVRDLVLGRKAKDWDIATNARPEEVTRLFQRVIPTGITHGTVTVLLGYTKIEVTTFRGDIGYSDGRHPDRVVFFDSLEEDLKRRDFTINAMAYDLARGQLIDPFGGRRDLRKHIIRAVGNPVSRFNEDGLRPLRAVRIACVLGFEIEKQTFLAIGKSLTVFRKIAAERVREELLKILASHQTARGIELLRMSGLLKEILPEIIPQIGHPQNRFHRYDLFTHTLKSLERSRGDAILKLAVLLHDIGKPQMADGPPGEYTFYGHEKLSSKLAERAMRRLRFSNEERKRVSSLIANHMFHYQPQWTDGALRRLIQRAGKNNLEDLWELRRADVWGRGVGVREALCNLRKLKTRTDHLIAKDMALKVTDLAIGGKEVMAVLGITPGPRVGQALEALLERVLDEPFLNTPETLKSLLAEIEF